MEAVEVVKLYAEILKLALPFTFVFWVCEMITTTVIRSALGGRLSFNIK